MTITTVKQETEARQRADRKIRTEGKGFAKWDAEKGWPARPHFASVEWSGPKVAGWPPEAIDDDSVLVV